MNTKRVNAAAGVILAAQKQRNTAAGIAMALEAAGLLQSPESAAELVALRQVQAIEQERPDTAFTHDCGIPLTRRLDCGHCPHEVCEDCDRCPHSCRCASPEDPHDSPLHHTYAVPRDLPEMCHCGHTALTHRPDGCIADAYHSGLLGLCGCTAAVTA